MAETPRPTEDDVDGLDEDAGEDARSIDEDAQFRAMAASIVRRDRELLDRLAR